MLYGLQGAPPDTERLPALFAMELTILLGEEDTERTDSSPRHNTRSTGSCRWRGVLLADEGDHLPPRHPRGGGQGVDAQPGRGHRLGEDGHPGHAARHVVCQRGEGLVRVSPLEAMLHLSVGRHLGDEKEARDSARGREGQLDPIRRHPARVPDGAYAAVGDVAGTRPARPACRHLDDGDGVAPYGEPGEGRREIASRLLGLLCPLGESLGSCGRLRWGSPAGCRFRWRVDVPGRVVGWSDSGCRAPCRAPCREGRDDEDLRCP